MTMPNPLADGAVTPFHEPAPNLPTDFGLDSGGINDNYQPTDAPTIDRHVI